MCLPGVGEHETHYRAFTQPLLLVGNKDRLVASELTRLVELHG
jgi:hypothetical protein